MNKCNLYIIYEYITKHIMHLIYSVNIMDLLKWKSCSILVFCLHSVDTTVLPQISFVQEEPLLLSSFLLF